jgi:hypothetical protein
VRSGDKKRPGTIGKRCRGPELASPDILVGQPVLTFHPGFSSLDAGSAVKMNAGPNFLSADNAS